LARIRDPDAGCPDLSIAHPERFAASCGETVADQVGQHIDGQSVGEQHRRGATPQPCIGEHFQSVHTLCTEVMFPRGWWVHVIAGNDRLARFQKAAATVHVDSMTPAASACSWIRRLRGRSFNFLSSRRQADRQGILALLCATTGPDPSAAARRSATIGLCAIYGGAPTSQPATPQDRDDGRHARHAPMCGANTEENSTVVDGLRVALSACGEHGTSTAVLGAKQGQRLEPGRRQCRRRSKAFRHRVTATGLLASAGPKAAPHRPPSNPTLTSLPHIRATVITTCVSSLLFVASLDRRRLVVIHLVMTLVSVDPTSRRAKREARLPGLAGGNSGQGFSSLDAAMTHRARGMRVAHGAGGHHTVRFETALCFCCGRGRVSGSARRRSIPANEIATSWASARQA
jgi:hypothetical protein